MFWLAVFGRACCWSLEDLSFGILTRRCWLVLSERRCRPRNAGSNHKIPNASIHSISPHQFSGNGLSGVSVPHHLCSLPQSKLFRRPAQQSGQSLYDVPYPALVILPLFPGGVLNLIVVKYLAPTSRWRNFLRKHEHADLLSGGSSFASQ